MPDAHLTARLRAEVAERAHDCCEYCHNRKYVSVDAVDPLTGELVAIFHPRRQRWSDHFAWNEDFTTVIGLTPTGRTTIEKLQLNRRGLVNLRRVW